LFYKKEGRDIQGSENLISDVDESIEQFNEQEEITQEDKTKEEEEEEQEQQEEDKPENMDTFE